MSRCDLHIHSRYSARSEEWLFRRLDFPDSYSDPKQLHEQLLKRRMDFVTITDHDAIEGCLKIAHLPRTFISEQVTTYFPSDPCKLHILVWGISEHQHREIEGVRDNVFELQRYLQAGQIAHAVAHPLYSVNGKLEARHLEQLTLLFKHFEGINGLRDALLSDLAQTLFKNLTPEKIDELANGNTTAKTQPELLPADLNEKERTVWTLLPADESIHIDILLETSGLSFGDLNTALVALDIRDLIRVLPGKHYARRL